MHATGFAELPHVSFIQLGNDLLDRQRHDFATPLPVTVNAVGTLVRDYIAVPVATFRVGGRFGSLYRYNFVRLRQWIT